MIYNPHNIQLKNTNQYVIKYIRILNTRVEKGGIIDNCPLTGWQPYVYLVRVTDGNKHLYLIRREPTFDFPYWTRRREVCG
jgi:hypothetical protein